MRIKYLTTEKHIILYNKFQKKINYLIKIHKILYFFYLVFFPFCHLLMI